MSCWPIMRRAALEPGVLVGVRVAGVSVLLLDLDGEVHAYHDRCAHQGVRLSDKGRLDGCRLTCQVHDWVYDARTGCGLDPADAGLRRFPVEIVDGDICVDVDPGPPISGA